MARDRLAAMRAQQQGSQGGGNNNNNPGYNSYPTQASSGAGGGYGGDNSSYGGGAGGGGGAGYGGGNQTQSNAGQGGYQAPRRANPYAQQDNSSYEMTAPSGGGGGYNNAPAAPSGGGGGDPMSDFYSEISGLQDALRTFNDNVSRISDLHSRSLNNMDDAAAQRNAQQLDALVDDTSALSGDLKRRVKSLERKGGSGRDAQVRKQQTAVIKNKFIEAIQAYQTVEQQYRQKYKQRMERQFKIVKPDASPDEVRAVVNDDTGGQIFSQALMNSNRYGESRAAYKEVQERHEDIKRIERTLGELAQLFNDMSIMVEQQEETINAIQETAQTVEKDTEAGLGYTGAAVESARAARKKRWICFAIMVVVLVIVGIVLAIVITNNIKAGKTAFGGTSS